MRPEDRIAAATSINEALTAFREGVNQLGQPTRSQSMLGSKPGSNTAVAERTDNTRRSASVARRAV